MQARLPVPRQRRLPLPRPGVRRAAVRARRRARRGVAADRRRGARSSRSGGARGTLLRNPDGDRLGRRAGADELLLLRRDRPAAAGDGGRDRVPAGDRARRDRRAHARATPPRSRSPSPASTCSPACTSRASRSASRSRSPTPALFAAYIVLAHRVAATRDRGHRRARRRDADRAGRGHADRRAGRRVPAFARPGRARWPASASGSRPR